MRTRRRASGLGAAMAMAAVVFGLSACEPAPTPPVFSVVDSGGGGDANPGDGLCRASDGTCTFQAAIEEANVLGVATIEIPSFYAELGRLPTINGRVKIQPQGTPTAMAELGPTTFVVAAGGHLDLERVRPATDTPVGNLRIEVAGSLQVKDAYLQQLDIDPGGSAVVVRSAIRSHPDYNQTALISNDGTLALLYSYAIVPIATGAGATTHVTASLVRATCTGSQLTSGGYNAGAAPACGLNGATDIPPGTYLDYTTLEGEWTYSLVGKGNLIDRVPLGVAGCAPAGSVPAPLVVARDSDGDGVAACEIGIRQVGFLPEGSEG